MKRFKGFTPEQEFKLLSMMGYQGGMDRTEMSNYIQANPEAQARLGKFAEAAQKRLSSMAAPKGFATGGMVDDLKSSVSGQIDSLKNTSQAAETKATGSWQPVTSIPKGAEYDGKNYILQGGQTYQWVVPESKSSSTSTSTTSTSTGQVPQGVQDAQKLTDKALNEPTTLVTPANIAQVATNANQFIQPGTGDAGDVQTGTATTVGTTQTAETPDKFDAATVDPTLLGDKVSQTVDQMEAATADPTKMATVQGQLEKLMQDFEGGGTPPWASGAMREAMAVMQRRGMGASSMAGAAVVQAAMESAIGIASQDAATQAQFEMQNLNNRQQTAIFKTQQTIAGLFTDQAAENAAKQFNAASENQVNQFFADLESTVSRFNADQINAIMKFNAGEKNAMEQFNTSLKAAREEFNAKNDLIIAQANTKWRQDIATMDTAAQNEANMEFARTANALTARAMDQIWQKERDIMSYAFASSESALQRAHELLLGDKAADAREDEAKGYIFFDLIKSIL